MGTTLNGKGALVEWVRGDEHLPAPLRDFHDQKDVFKCVEDALGRSDEPFGVDWMRGQCFVIDKFLKFMAYHGWTLQRSRARVPFYDLAETIREREDRETEAMRSIFATRRTESVTATTPHP